MMQNYHKVLTQKEIKEFVLDRFQQVKKSNKIKELVEFQARNKFLIMAHNQEELKVLGRIVASNKKVIHSEMLKEYEKNLNICLQNTEVDTAVDTEVFSKCEINENFMGTDPWELDFEDDEADDIERLKQEHKDKVDSRKTRQHDHGYQDQKGEVDHSTQLRTDASLELCY